MKLMKGATPWAMGISSFAQYMSHPAPSPWKWYSYCRSLNPVPQVDVRLLEESMTVFASHWAKFRPMKVSWGCSSLSNLAEAGCEGTISYCWHRCWEQLFWHWVAWWWEFLSHDDRWSNLEFVYLVPTLIRVSCVWLQCENEKLLIAFMIGTYLNSQRAPSLQHLRISRTAPATRILTTWLVWQQGPWCLGLSSVAKSQTTLILLVCLK